MKTDAMLPNAYRNLETARARYGEQADRFAAHLWRGDPLADAVVGAFAELPAGQGSRLLDQALTEGIAAVPDAPPALAALFAQIDTVPAWVDPARCERGGATFLRCRLGFVALACLSLPIIYSWAAGNKPLTLSGRLVHQAAPRLKETTRFVYAICSPSGLARNGEGFALLVRVRLMHAQIRRLIRHSGQWREAVWGCPIDGAHLAATNLLFSLGVLDGLARIGYRFTGEERESVLHLWRYAGWLLGVDEELLCANEAQARRLLAIQNLLEPEPDADSRNLTDALMTAARDYAHSFPILRRVSVHLCYGISRSLIGRARADALAYPRTLWRWLVPVLRPAVWLVETARLFSRYVQELAKRAGPQAMQHILSERGLPGRVGSFDLPDHLDAAQ